MEPTNVNMYTIADNILKKYREHIKIDEGGDGLDWLMSDHGQSIIKACITNNDPWAWRKGRYDVDKIVKDIRICLVRNPDATRTILYKILDEHYDAYKQMIAEIIIREAMLEAEHSGVYLKIECENRTQEYYPSSSKYSPTAIPKTISAE